eukprot:1904620-Pleurochrysis_carterae.AAC.2
MICRRESIVGYVKLMCRRWDLFFVDDVRCHVTDPPSSSSPSPSLAPAPPVAPAASSIEQLPLQLLLQHSLASLVRAGALATLPMLTAACRTALPHCPPPQPHGVREHAHAHSDAQTHAQTHAHAHTHAGRQAALSELLQHRRFGDLLERGLVGALSAAAPDGASMQQHTAIAATGRLGGTFRSAVHAAAKQSVARCVRKLLATLDANFNLALLHACLTTSTTPRARAMAELWFVLAEEVISADAALLATIPNRQNVDDLDEDVEVVNTGRHGTLVARFPFSARLVRMLDRSEMKEVFVEAQAMGGEGRTVELVSRVAALGEAAYGGAG